MSDTFVLQESLPRDGDGENREFEVIPEDTILEAELLSVQKVVKPFTDDDGKPIVRVEFAFRILDEGRYHNRRVWGETSTTFTSHPDCKMRAWVQEVLAVPELPKDFIFNTDSVVGSQARIVIGTKPGKNRDGSPVTRNFVKDVIRSRTAVQAAVAAGKYEEEIF